MFCAFHNEHILIARVFYIEHKSVAKVQQKLHICKRSGYFLRKKAIYRLFVSIEWLLGACSQIVTRCLQMQGR